MKKLLSFMIFVLCILLATTAYAGGWGHYGSLGYSRSSIFGSFENGGSIFGNLGYGDRSLFGGSRYYGGGGYRGGRNHGNHKSYYRGHGGYYGGGITTGYIGTPTFIEYVPQPVYYVPAPVYYEPAPVSESTTVAAPVPEAPAPVAVAATDNVPKGHWEVQKIWVPNNKSSWIEKYYDEERDVLVLTNREQKLGTNGHWAEREIWVEDE